MTTHPDTHALSTVARTRPLRGLDARTLDRWQALAGRAAESNPYAEPAVVLAAAEHLPGGNRALLLSVEHGEEMTFALPVEREPATRHRPFPVLGTWKGYYPPLATPLLDPAHGEAAWRAVRAALSHQAHAAWLLLDPMTADGPVAAALRAAAPARTLETLPRAVAYREGGARVRPSEKTQRSLRARRRKLEAMAGVPAVTFRVDPGAPLPDGLAEEFLALEASGWKGRGGTALASRPETAAFFRALVGVQAARGGLQIVGIRCGERLVAATVNLVSRDGVYFHKIAYDEEFHTASPGRILMADTMNAFADDPSLAYADSCADPGASLSNQMLHDRRTVATMVVPADGAVSGLLGHAALMARDTRDRLRHRPRESG